MRIDLNQLLEDLRPTVRRNSGITELKRPLPKFDGGIHRWVTVGGQHVMIRGDGSGPVNPPKWMGDPDKEGDSNDDGLYKGKVTAAQKKALAKEQANVDKLLGAGHGVKVVLDKNGKPVLQNDDAEEAVRKAGGDPADARVPAGGGDLLDSALSVLSLIDTFSALTLRMARRFASTLEKAARDMYSGLEDWMQKGPG